MGVIIKRGIRLPVGRTIQGKTGWKPFQSRTSWKSVGTKYGNKKVERDGKTFASGFEGDLYSYLSFLVKAGELSGLRSQVNVRLTRAEILMIPDFAAIETKTGKLIYFEAKGFETDVWRIKKRLWKVYGPAPLRIYKGSVGKTLKLVEEIIPIG